MSPDTRRRRCVSSATQTERGGGRGRTREGSRYHKEGQGTAGAEAAWGVIGQKLFIIAEKARTRGEEVKGAGVVRDKAKTWDVDPSQTPGGAGGLLFIITVKARAKGRGT